MSETANPTASSADVKENLHFIAKMRTNIETLSRQWASMSLNVSKTALESGANNLRTAADYLGELAARIENPAVDVAAAAATGEAEPSEVTPGEDKPAPNGESKSADAGNAGDNHVSAN